MASFAGLIELLGLLQSAPSRTGEELAAELGVTLRTIRRYVGRLRAAGFQVEAAPGVHGGYSLAPGTQMTPLVLSEDEAFVAAVALGGTATETVNGIEAGATRRVLAKLEQVTPSPVRDRIAAMREHTVSMLRTPASPCDLTTLSTLAGACRERRRVRFDYRSGSGQETAREVEPYKLVQTSHCWYLVARDTATGDWRTLRVDRIADALVTPWVFGRANPPDVERVVTFAMSVAPYPNIARIHVSAPVDDVLRHVPRSYGLVEAADAKSSTLTVGFEDERWLVHFIADLPWDVQVVEPAWLSDALAALGRRLVAAHAPADG